MLSGAARARVALRKESVDRNAMACSAGQPAHGSLSARRAWIEMLWRAQRGSPRTVALRKESVDRNYAVCADHHKRRLVALRKESVDRNQKQVFAEIVGQGRSPQGERG